MSSFDLHYAACAHTGCTNVSETGNMSWWSSCGADDACGPRIFLKKHKKEKSYLFRKRVVGASRTRNTDYSKTYKDISDVKYNSSGKLKKNHPLSITQTWNEHKSLVKCFWFLWGSWSLYRRNNIGLLKLELINLIGLISWNHAIFLLQIANQSFYFVQFQIN